MKNKIYFLLLLNNFSTSRENQKLIKKQTFKKVNKDSSNSYIWKILGMVGAIIILLVYKNKIIEFQDSIFKKNTKSDINSKYKLTQKITDYKIIDYNNKNLINLNDFKDKDTEISKNQLKKICEEYIQYIDRINKQEIINYDEVVLISNYYDDLENLLKNIFNNDKTNNIIKIIEGSSNKSNNAILKSFIGDHGENKTSLDNNNIRNKGIKNILNALNLLKEHLNS